MGSSGTAATVSPHRGRVNSGTKTLMKRDGCRLTRPRGGDMFQNPNKCPGRVVAPRQEVTMSADSSSTGGSVAEGLDRRQRQGKPVRIGLIGAGQMGTDILVQTDLMT